MQISSSLKGIGQSPTIEMAAKARVLRAQGKPVINLGVGEPDFDTPQNIKAAAVKAIVEGKTKYTPVSGILELRERAATKLFLDNGVKYLPEQIIVSAGAKQSLTNAFYASLNPGDEVIIPSPFWPSYPEQVKFIGAVPVIAQTENFAIKPEALEELITSKTKMLILNSPNNPSGAMIGEEDLKGIADLAVKYGFSVVSDEVYEYLTFDGAKHVSIASLGPEIKEQTITINGVSKAYAMTGWRIGYAAAPKEMVKAMEIVQGQMATCPTSISQYASVEALSMRRDSPQMQAMLKEYDRRRKFVVNELNKIGLPTITPQGAFYVFPNISPTGLSSVEFSNRLLEERFVSTVPGEGLGDGRCVRISYATSFDNLVESLGRIKEFVEEL